MKRMLKPKYAIGSLHFLVWGALLLLLYFVSTPKNGYRLGIIPPSFYMFTVLINIVIFYTHAYYLYPVFFHRRKWWWYLLLNTVLIELSFQVKALVWHVGYPDVAHGSSNWIIFPPSIFAFILSFIYRTIIDRIQLEQQQKDKQATQTLAELKFLRSQISPHFLFNVLTNLVSLARKKSDALEPSLIKLADLLRYMLYDTQGKKVALHTEIEYLNNYLDLQKLRFGADIDIDSKIEVEPPDRFLLIEPMLLIPFVENAFKHGVGYSGRPDISLRLSVAWNTLTFEMRNKFENEPANAKDDSSGIGLGNVIARLDLLYRNKYTLAVNDANNLFHIILTLKLL